MYAKCLVNWNSLRLLESIAGHYPCIVAHAYVVLFFAHLVLFFWSAVAVFLVCGCCLAVGVLEVSWVDPTVFLCSLQAWFVRLPRGLSRFAAVVFSSV